MSPPIAFRAALSVAMLTLLTPACGDDDDADTADTTATDTSAGDDAPAATDGTDATGTTGDGATTSDASDTSESSESSDTGGLTDTTGGDSTEPLACPTPNAAFDPACEPRIAACQPASIARDAESYRGTFGSVSAQGACQSDWPAAWLADCTEPLPPGVPDMRGLWADEGHVERIEQCGQLVIIVGDNYTHGGYATGEPDDGVNDFRADGTCAQPIRVGLAYEGNTLQFRQGSIVVVTRTLVVADDGADELVWVFAGSERARMRRYCNLSEVPPTAVSGLPAN